MHIRRNWAEMQSEPQNGVTSHLTTIQPRPWSAGIRDILPPSFTRLSVKENQAVTHGGNSVAFLIVAALQLFVCEVNLLVRLWRKGWGQTGFDRYLTPYLLPVVIVVPLVAALMQRRRFKRWEESGELPSATAAKINIETGVGAIGTYALIQLLMGW